MSAADLSAAFDHIDRYLSQRHAEELGPGMALAITDRERVLHTAYFGMADLTTKEPVAAHHLFELGSIGKTFTAVGIMQQVEAGRIDLHAPVSQYLPWFAFGASHDQPITVHHVLSHTAGLPSGTEVAEDYEVYRLRECSSDWLPGQKFWYSNVGFKLLAVLLAKVAGQSFGEVLQQGILDRLDMKESIPLITNAGRSRLAVGYASYYDDRPNLPSYPTTPAPWYEYRGGDGSLATTASDLAAFLRCLLNRGAGLISEQSFEQMSQPLAKTDWGVDYGYGLFVGQDEEMGGHKIISHGGGMIGYYVYMAGDMDAGYGVVLYINKLEWIDMEGHFILKTLHAASNGEELPDLPTAEDKQQIENAADYAGSYGNGDRKLTFVAEGERLLFEYGGERLPLTQTEGDSFLPPHPDFAKAAFTFGRNEAGEVVELFNREDWYPGAGYDGPTAFDHPAEWHSYVGQYRAHSVFYPVFSIGILKGELQCYWGEGQLRSMHLRSDGSFALDEPDTPERIRFDTEIDGQCWRAIWNGAEYYRTDHQPKQAQADQHTPLAP